MFKKETIKKDLFFMFLLMVVVFVHLSRIRLGMVEMDESFYLTIPFRLLQGDALLVDEWHLSQLSGVLLLPVLKMYLAIVGSTEGIYLAFRYIWLICSLITAIISYILLRKKNPYIGAVSCVMICLFTYGGLRALSYNTMGVMATWLLVVLSVTETKFYKFKYILMGIIMAAVILCNPYMIILYVGYACACLAKRKKNGYYGCKALGYVTLGGAIIAALLLIFVFSRASFNDVLQNLQYIFNDPAHQQKSISTFFEPIVEFVIWFKLYFLFFAVGTTISVFSCKLRKLAFVGLISLSGVMWILLVVFKTQGIGRFAIYLPLTMLGAVAFALTKKKDWTFFNRGWIIGFVYAMCMNFSSNQGIYVICNALIISSGASLFLIKDYMEEKDIWPGKKLWLGVLAGMQLLSQIWISWNYVFWAENISELNYVIDSGPMKGVVVTSEEKKDYEVNLANIEEYGDLTGKYIMFFNHFPAGYFFVPEARCGAFSAWITECKTPDHEKIIHYYELHPEKIPDVVYFDTKATCHWSEDEWLNWREENGF